MAQTLADSLPEWRIVLLPPLWYGVDGANRIPEREDVLGTFSLRPATLRAIVADLGSQLADRGFRWLFLVHIHGAPLEHAALSDGADFLRETRGIGVFNIGSIEYGSNDPAVDSAIGRRFSAAERARIGFDVHAGFAETSTILAVRPDLVGSQLRSMPDVSVGDWQTLLDAGRRREWSGYWSAPALADSGIGRRILDSWAARWSRLALRAIRGEDLSKLARFPDGTPDNPAMQMSSRTVFRQHAFDSAFTTWIANRHSLVDHPPAR
jgi:creatinine amidohydrolase/Fe(II)-dependent formamide hydrolase-like protein